MKKQNHDLQRGTIGHSAMAAMVTSVLFRHKTERNIKGKGSYSRKNKHANRQGTGDAKVFC